MEFRWKIGDTWYSNDPQDKNENKKVQKPTSGDLIDEIISEYERKGGFENLEGKGKPLDIRYNPSDEYLFNNVLKNANVLPPWLELQHEIRDSICELIATMKRNETQDLQSKIDVINKKIKLFNSKCPVTSLQKPLVTKETIEQQYTKWL
jgi:hypothetical protein